MMEYCTGGDLFNRLEVERAKPGGVSQRALLSWCAQIADAVAFIHSKVRSRPLSRPPIYPRMDGSAI